MKVEKIKGIMYAVDKKNDIRTPIGELIVNLQRGTSIEDIQSSHMISGEHPHEWRSIAEAIFNEWKGMNECNDVGVIDNCNDVLKGYAFSLPSYSTSRETDRILKGLQNGTIDETTIAGHMASIVMDYRFRAQQHTARFMKIDLFKEFAYFIDSAVLSYYRGNMAAAFFTLVPVIEGVLLRWMGYPRYRVKKPEFKEIKEFIGKSVERNPLPIEPHQVESYVNVADSILRNHFYLSTEEGDAHAYFNRHLALHMLDEKEFYTSDNVVRAVLLLDILNGIYIREQRIDDPLFDHLDDVEFIDRLEAYLCAFIGSNAERVPEKILSQYSCK